MGYLESEVSKISAEVLVRQATGRELQSSLRDYSDAVNENARELGAERSRDGGKAHQQPSIFRLPKISLFTRAKLTFRYQGCEV